jgi:hypothetical protein
MRVVGSGATLPAVHPREKLRQAAMNLVDVFLDALRTEIAEVVRAEVSAEHDHPTAIARKPPATPSEDRSPDTVATRLVQRLAERGPETADGLLAALGVSRSTFFRAVTGALAAGSIMKERDGHHVRYRSAAETVASEGVQSSAVPASSEARTRVVDFLVNFGSSSKAAISQGTRLEGSLLDEALATLVSDGGVRRSGTGRATRYAFRAPKKERVRRAENDTDAPRTSPAQTALREKVVAYVRENPGAQRKTLLSVTGASEAQLHAVCRAARALGELRMEGEKRFARYFASDATAPTSPPADVEMQTTSTEAVELDEDHATADVSGEADPDVVRGITAILAELRRATATDMHDIRLQYLLQALVADVRELQGRLPREHPLHLQIASAMREVGRVREARELKFILGLSRQATADWGALAAGARKKLGRFDEDAEKELAPRRPLRPTPPPTSETRIRKDLSERRVALPGLCGLAKERPVVLVGGIKKNELLEQIRDRYALDVEWVAMQGANARVTEHFLARIKRGALGAVIIFEGLFGHAQVNGIVAALKETGTPFAYGDRGGTESLRQAILGLEEKFALRPAQGA